MLVAKKVNKLDRVNKNLEFSTTIVDRLIKSIEQCATWNHRIFIYYTIVIPLLCISFMVLCRSDHEAVDVAHEITLTA